MSLFTFIHSDRATKKRKLYNWWHRNDWRKAHSPSLRTRIRTEWYYIRHKKSCLIVDGWLLKFYETKDIYMNFGDDINVYLLERLTGKKIIPHEMLLFRNIHGKYTCIGSVIPNCMNRRTMVWGSGCMNFELEIGRRQTPQEIKAVRGPLTREYLLKHGIDCPEVYGDPALLLPKVYQPTATSKRHPVTIIPHHKDWDDKETLMAYVGKCLPDAHIINITNYTQWSDVIDEIVHSEVVFSSSLHGLIVCDAYGIPNNFTEFIYHHPQYDKYKDYYLSLDTIAKRTIAPIQPIYAEDIPQYIESIKRTYQRYQMDLRPLINACPFKLSI